MTEHQVYELQATLTGSSITATLLRVLTILHSRADDVLELSFDAHHPAGGLLTGKITSARSGAESLQAWLEQPVDVFEASVVERRLVACSNG